MTETAEVADVVLPATMFVEHDDIYQGGGHQYIILGPKIIEPPEECRPNHAVIRELARRLGAEHPGFEMTEREIIDRTLALSRWPGLKCWSASIGSTASRRSKKRTTSRDSLTRTESSVRTGLGRDPAARVRSER